MTKEDAIQQFVKVQVWIWMAGAYSGCLSPIWLDGLGLGTIGAAACMAILVTYVLTRIYHDLMLISERLARLVYRSRP